MQSFSLIDSAVLVLYLVGMLCIGIISQRKIKGISDFYIANRSLGTFVLLATVCASILGGSAMIGRGGIMYGQGVVGIFLGLPYLIGMYVFAAMSGRIQAVGQKNNISSIPDLMSYRFGDKIRYLVGALIAFCMMATVASQIAAFATIIGIIGGISFEAAAWIALVLIVAYTSVSGLYGVVYTDVIQFAVLMLAIYILLPIRSVAAAGGISSILQSVPPELLQFKIPPEMVGWIFTNLIFTFAGAEMWQRAFAAKSRDTAFRGVFLGNTIYAFTILITVILALSAVVLYPNIVQDYGTADAAIPALAMNLLPTGILGLGIAGMVAVIMSTADTYLLISVQTVVRDMIGSACKNISERQELRLTKIFSVLLGIGALVISLYIKGVYNVLMFAWTFYAASVGIPAIATLYWKKATSWGIGAGVISGFVSSIGWKLMGVPFGLSESLVGSLTCGVFTIVVSLATCRKYPSLMPEYR